MNDSLKDTCEAMARRAKEASRVLAQSSSAKRDVFLATLADRLKSNVAAIEAANLRDLQGPLALELSAAMRERLAFNGRKIEGSAKGVFEVTQLPDPIGKVLSGSTRPNGLEIRKIRVPLGVVFFLYESRPNVTLDAAALCVKSGNAVILRGGKEASHTNKCLHALIADSLAQAELPADCVQLVESPDREAIDHLLRLPQYIDLAIPRGGEALIRRVVEQAKMPVLKHYLGNCHVYVHEAADQDMAIRIILNAKCQRPGVCNAMESLLVDRAIAPSFLPRVGAALAERGVELRTCEVSHAYLPKSQLATEADFGAEYCDLILSMKTVAGIDEAIAHIARFGSGHTDAIVTRDIAAARRFQREVDSAAVVVNASTRFNDGFELGLGAEIGISTDKFHARGPCGLEELTTTKYLVTGDGHVRE